MIIFCKIIDTLGLLPQIIEKVGSVNQALLKSAYYVIINSESVTVTKTPNICEPDFVFDDENAAMYF